VRLSDLLEKLARPKRGAESGCLVVNLSSVNVMGAISPGAATSLHELGPSRAVLVVTDPDFESLARGAGIVGSACAKGAESYLVVVAPRPYHLRYAELSLRSFPGLPAAVLVRAGAAQALIEVMAFVLPHRSLHLAGVYEGDALVVEAGRDEASLVRSLYAGASRLAQNLGEGGRVLLMMLFPEWINESVRSVPREVMERLHGMRLEEVALAYRGDGVYMAALRRRGGSG